MSKKSNYIFLLFTLFIFFISFVLAISPYSWGGCGRALGGEGSRVGCVVGGENWLPQEAILDENNDGNISFELGITNGYDYDLNKVTLNIEKCSSEVKFDSIKNGDIVHVKIGDVCVYEGDFFLSNSLFTYFDENNILKSYRGKFEFPVIKKTELIKIRLKEKFFIFSKIIIPILVLLIIFFVIKKLFKRFKK